MSETVITPGSIAAAAAPRGSGVLHLNPIAIAALAEQARAPLPTPLWTPTTGAVDTADLRRRAESADLAKKLWIAIALQAAAGHLTVADVLMRASSKDPGTPESTTQALGAALESARRRIGPAVANPLIVQAGLG